MSTKQNLLHGAGRPALRALAGVAFLLALSACQMTDSEMEALPPAADDALLSDQEAWGAGQDTPSEFSDATGEMGL